MKTLAVAVLSIVAAGLLTASPARSSWPPVGTLTIFSCTITPGGTTQTNGSCVTNTPGFNFNANFDLNVALEPSYTVEWSITSVLGPAPQIGSGCTSSTPYCDLNLQTTSTSNTKVQVRADVYQMPAHTLVLSGQVTARAPCTTVKTNNHPTLC